MNGLRYFVVFFALLKCHFVCGDFGISPVIVGATTVEQYTRRTLTDADALVSAYNDIPLNGPVVAFNEAGAALKAVYRQIVTFVQPVMQSLGSLALNRVGTVETLFADVDTKINAMTTFITGTGPSLLATVETKVSTYVRAELNLILGNMNTTLTNLKSAMATLKTGVISARTNNATSSSVSMYVKPSMVQLVQQRTQQLGLDVSGAKTSASESARTIDQANVFIQIGVDFSGETWLNELWEGDLLADFNVVMSFQQQLMTLATTEISLVKANLGQFTNTFSNLTTPLRVQYEDVATVYGRITNGTNDNVLNAYKTLVSIVAAYVNELLTNVYPPIAPAIRRLAEVLVQRGPYANTCFYTYYPEISYYLYSGEDVMDNCLEDELVNAAVLKEAVQEILYQMRFFLEDTYPYLKICYRLSLFDTDLANECLVEHTSFSSLIPCTAIKEYATMLQVLCKEVDSLLFRLWACVTRDMLPPTTEAANMLALIESCQLNGL